MDYASLEALVEFQIEQGTHALVPCGSTGESATLDHAEHHAVIDAVVRAARRRVPVIAGTGSNSTREAMDLTRAAEKAGAEGALLISPYYNKPTQEGIYRHYRAVAEHVGIPLIVYNIPGRTASKMEPETLARLAEIDNVAGVKEATGSVDQALDVIRTCAATPSRSIPARTRSFTRSWPSAAKGVITTTGNVAPRAMADLTEACLREDWATGRRIQFELLPLIRSLFSETNPIPVKTALALMDKCGPELRLPLTAMGESNLEQLKTAMLEYGLYR